MATVTTIIPPCLLLVICLSYQLHPVASADPILSDPDIISSNKSHKANASSYIQWGKLPKSKSVELSNGENSDGLEGLFKFCRTFMYTALNENLPLDFIQKVRSHKLNLFDDLKKLIFTYPGFTVAIFVGIIFVILFPIIGFFFCCCRCCGNCGGKMIQSPKDNSGPKRKILSFLLLLGVIFSASGTAFMFASDTRLTEKIQKMPVILPKVMNALAVFGDNTYRQVDFVGSETIDFLLEVIFRDLNNLDVLIGLPLREELDQKAEVRTIFKTVRELSQNLNNLTTSMDNVNTQIKDVGQKADALITKMTNVKKEIDKDHKECQQKAPSTCPGNLQTNSLQTTFNKNQLPDITKELNKIKSVNLTAQIAQPEQDFEDIPELVNNKSDAKVQGVIKNLVDLKNKHVPTILDLARKFKENLDAGKIAGQDLGMLTNKGGKYLDLVKPFNKMRNYAFLGLAGFCLFIIGLLFFGLVLGCCGQDDTVKPVNRGCVSNCGGCLLMGAVVFIFLSGWLLMLLTTVMFIPGAVIEVYGCKTLREIGQGSMDKILKAVFKEDAGNLLFQNSSLNVTISGIYNDCEDGEGLYLAARLHHLVDFDKIFNYPRDKGVRKDLTSINVNLSSIEIFSPAMQDQLDDFQSSMDIDFKKFKNELSKVPKPSSLDGLIANLDQLGNFRGTYGAKFKQHANSVRDIQKKESQELSDSSQKLSDTLSDLEANTIATNKTIDKLASDMSFSQDVINNDGSDIVKNILNDFADRIFGVWTNFDYYVTTLVNHKIAKCRPITNIYKYLAIDSLCGVVDSFNAYWFGLGWCLFFLVFNLIIAVKLAKHFRRMKYSDELDGSKDDILLNSVATPRSKRRGTLHPNNRIGQMPRY